MRRILESIKSGVCIYIDIIITCFQTIFARNPCDRCLVSICCDQRCSEKAKYDSFVHNGVFPSKLVSFMVLILFTISLPTTILAVILTIYEKVIL